MHWFLIFDNVINLFFCYTKCLWPCCEEMWEVLLTVLFFLLLVLGLQMFKTEKKRILRQFFFGLFPIRIALNSCKLAILIYSIILENNVCSWPSSWLKVLKKYYQTHDVPAVSPCTSTTPSFRPGELQTWMTKPRPLFIIWSQNLKIRKLKKINTNQAEYIPSSTGLCKQYTLAILLYIQGDICSSR